MKLEKINPVVKAFTVLIIVILLSFQYKTWLNVSVFALALLLLVFFSEAKLQRIIVIMIPALFAAFGLFMMGLYYAKGTSVSVAELSDIASVPYIVRATMSRNFETALQLSTRLLAYAGMGMIFALTTKGEMFVYSMMHQLHVSPQFAYGILAAFHLMPNMVKEYKSVKTAYEVRGIRTGLFSMQVLFTMLVNSIRWSECVAAAMESKGFCAESERTYYTVIRIQWYDYACSFLCITGVLSGMFLG